MPVFIARNSALEFWRNSALRESAAPTKASPHPNSPPTVKECRTARNIGLDNNGPLEIVVGECASRRHPENTRCFAWKGCSLSGSFFKIQNGIYVASPESCFLQLAGVLPVIELIKIGYELCGAYSLCPRSDTGFEQCKPLTSVEALRRYTAKATGLVGAKRARQALQHIVNGSASPAETHATMLLCLPTSLGGFGLPLPKLNERIELLRGGEQLTANNYFKCDLYWPGIKTAIEYDSDLWHTEEPRLSNDTGRRNALESMGITVLVMRKHHLYDARETEKISLIIARKMGRHHRTERKDAMTKRHELRQALLLAP